jgi:hypothetical protein
VLVGYDEVVIRQADIPERDILTVRGVPCTRPPRVLLEIASELEPDQLDDVLEDWLARKLLTVPEVRARAAEEDLRDREGTRLVLEALDRYEDV